LSDLPYKEKDKQREHGKKYYMANKQKIKEYCQIPKVRERRKEYGKKYNKINKEKLKQYNKKYHKEYFKQPEIKQRKKEYAALPRTIEYQKKYNQKTQVIQHRKEWSKRYYQLHKEKRNKYSKQYRQEHKEQFKKYYIKKEAKRRHSLRWIELFSNPFPEEIKVDYHHINNMLVVPMPKKFHLNSASRDIDEHRERANFWLYYTYNIDFDLLWNKMEI
jgi:hypothetical protein